VAASGIAFASTSEEEVQVPSNAQMVQCQNRGKIAAILVKDGANVIAGQPLLKLEPEDANTQSDFDLYNNSFQRQKLTTARLIAELFCFDKFIPSGMVFKEQELANFVKDQQSLFDSKVQSLCLETSKDVDDDLRDLYKQMSEHGTITDVMARRLQEIPTFLVGGSQAQPPEGRYSAQSFIDHAKQAVQDIEAAKYHVADLYAQVQPFKEALEKTIIRAPIAGKIIVLKPHIGAVIFKGDNVMGIVPQDK
jgi:multidrug resistance efflux pump